MPSSNTDDLRRRDATRRALDILASSLLILLTLPVIAFCAVGSAVSLRAWPLFSQERLSRDGRPFRFIKIRTLPPATPAYVDKHALDTVQIPAFCRFLRTTHLDELPQLFLVLGGRMSLVGPRPEMAALYEAMDPTFAQERTSVRPGCTGLWQVSVASSGLISESPEFDRFYLQNRSLWLDLWVMWRTALKMTRLSPPVTLDGVPSWIAADSMMSFPGASALATEDLGDARVPSR